jgi:hypothetical protein
MLIVYLLHVYWIVSRDHLEGLRFKKGGRLEGLTAPETAISLNEGNTKGKKQHFVEEV